MVQRRLERADPVEFWLSRVAKVTRVSYRGSLLHFLAWLTGRPEWVGVDARGLLMRQAEAEDPYEILELLQEYVNGLDKCRNGRLCVYAAVRSFFIHNRCALPKDPSFQVRGEKPGVVPKLALEHLADLAKAATIRDRSIILVKWQSLQDNSRLVHISNHCAEQIVRQVKAGIHPVRIDLPGRKRNLKPYYTFIGKDAIDALVQYFEVERGWPKPGEPVWLMKYWDGKKMPLTIPGLTMMWLRLIRRVGLIPRKKGSQGIKYGYNLHEMRHIAKSLLHTNATVDGFDMDVCKWMMGHTVDHLGYDKFHQNTEYVRKHYLLSEKCLNIISTPPGAMSEKEQNQIRGLMREMEELKRDLLEIREARRMEQRQHTLIGIETAEKSGV